jgi:hypothetical protein
MELQNFEEYFFRDSGVLQNNEFDSFNYEINVWS